MTRRGQRAPSGAIRQGKAKTEVFMKQGIIAIDLGTTNVKVVLFDTQLNIMAEKSNAVSYLRSGSHVEFDAEQYYDTVQSLIADCTAAAYGSAQNCPVLQIVLTGQAESLVALGENMRPARLAISWMDERSTEEIGKLKAAFDPDECYHITGQPEILPTWPVTKMLWIREHEPEVFAAVKRYVLLKDYIQYRLCGVLAGDHSIYNFSHYFDIVNKKFWSEILDFVGVSTEQLPDTVPSGTVIGTITEQTARETGISAACKVNVGTLDHFAGMIGCGNIHEGMVSESTGTVLALAAMLDAPMFSQAKMQLHCGPFPGTYVLLPVCESGGFALEWYKKNFMPGVSYREIDETCAQRARPNEMIFLPYITGSNAPDFNADAKGVFYGFKAQHDAYDFALAGMEGVALMLDYNIRYMKDAGVRINRIISTGGGAKSSFWNQLKADVTGQKLTVPVNKEAACLGAAIMGCVSEVIFPDYDAACAACVRIEQEFLPEKHGDYEAKIAQYHRLYKALQPVFSHKGGICS